CGFTPHSSLTSPMVKYRFAGIGGRLMLTFLLLSAMSLLHQGFQLLAGMEGHHTTRGDRDFFAGFGVATGTLRLVAQLEVAETGKLDALAAFQGQADFLEKGFDHVLRFALVETDLLEQHIGQLGLRESHSFSPRSVVLRRSGSPTHRSTVPWRRRLPRRSACGQYLA